MSAVYLFTDHALGLTTDAQDKLVELVDGRGAQDFKGKRIRWKSVGALAEDLGRNRQSDNLFGPKVGEEIRENLARSLTEFNLYPGSRREKLSMSRPG